MRKETCENCKWRNGNDSLKKTTEGGSGFMELGECWRFPRIEKRGDKHFCGEFKKKPKK